MGGGFKHRPEGMDGLLARIEALEARVQSLTNAPPIKNSAINGGSLIVLDDLGNVVARIGQTILGERGMSLVTPDGVEVLTYTARNAITGLPLMALQDNLGNVVTGGDSAGPNGGIFWPWLLIPFGGMTISQWPFNTTGSFNTIAQAGTSQASQRLFVECRTICDGGATAGQVRLLANGNQVGSTVAVGTGVGDAAFNGLVTDYVGMGGYEFLEIQTRVTAGAGNCRAQAYQAQWMNHG